MLLSVCCLQLLGQSKQDIKPLRKRYSAFSATTMTTPTELSGYGEKLQVEFRMALRISDIQEQLAILKQELEEYENETSSSR